MPRLQSKSLGTRRLARNCSYSASFKQSSTRHTVYVVNLALVRTQTWGCTIQGRWVSLACTTIQSLCNSGEVGAAHLTLCCSSNTCAVVEHVSPEAASFGVPLFRDPRHWQPAGPQGRRGLAGRPEDPPLQDRGER